MYTTDYILIAEDDEDDFLLLSDALIRCFPDTLLEWVKDGEALMQHLNEHPAPRLIFLDLNMPKKDGREALREIKSREELKHIPVVVLTTSNSEADVLGAYQAGTNTFIRKPDQFARLVESMETCRRYWFDVAITPQ